MEDRVLGQGAGKVGGCWSPDFTEWSHAGDAHLGPQVSSGAAGQEAPLHHVGVQ